MSTQLLAGNLILHTYSDDCIDLADVLADLSKKEGKNQESIQSSTTPDPGYQLKSDNFTIRHHKREPRGLSFHSR